MNIHLQIDRINLDGFRLTAHERAQFQAALEGELSTLLMGHGEMAMEDIQLPTLRTTDVTWNGNPTALGTQVAQAIYGGMGNNGKG